MGHRRSGRMPQTPTQIGLMRISKIMRIREAVFFDAGYGYATTYGVAHCPSGMPDPTESHVSFLKPIAEHWSEYDRSW